MILVSSLYFLLFANNFFIKENNGFTIKNNNGINKLDSELKINNEIVLNSNISLIIRRNKRYIGLSKRFKLNKRYQECIGPDDVKGHCKHLIYCPAFAPSGNVQNMFDYLCIIEKVHVGICCPDDIALSGLAGSQIILDLPGGGNDYEDKDNTTGCGIPAEGRSVSVAKKATIQEWPWLVAFYRPKQMQQHLEQQFCGGAIITEQHILTAAHCFQGITIQDIRVRLGEYDFTKLTETRSFDYAISEIIPHENFEVATYANDIAIVKLERATSFNSYIWPICLPPNDDRNYENETVVVAGWGQQYYSGPTSEVLLHVSVPVWPHEKCVNSFLQRITEDNICAAAFEGGKDSCLGDSGGPLMYQLKNGRWVAIGVVSWGIGCGNAGNPGVYTKVRKYIPWIIKHTITKQ